jgi:adenylosuccinate synthase
MGDGERKEMLMFLSNHDIIARFQGGPNAGHIRI